MPLGVKDRYVPLICMAAPIITFFINIYSVTLFGGYKFGFELLLLNGLLTFVGLIAISKKLKKQML
jgi:hypothetical protein